MKITTLRVIMIALFSAALIAADAPTTAPSTAPDENGPAKFYGPIVAVDANAKTFTVGDQTFFVIGETQMTKAADDSAATLADAVVGEPARGTYTKTSDGKLNVTKVRFGKKAGGGKGGGKKSADSTTQPAK